MLGDLRREILVAGGAVRAAVPSLRGCAAPGASVTDMSKHAMERGCGQGWLGAATQRGDAQSRHG